MRSFHGIARNRSQFDSALCFPQCFLFSAEPGINNRELRKHLREVRGTRGRHFRRRRSFGIAFNISPIIERSQVELPRGKKGGMCLLQIAGRARDQPCGVGAAMTLSGSVVPFFDRAPNPISSSSI